MGQNSVVSERSTPDSVATTTPTGSIVKTPTASPSVTQVPTSKPVQTPVPSSTPAGSKSYSLVEVAKHGNDSSCWSVVNGQVYDLTSWISKHPGGEAAILSICGKDGSSAFNDQHSGERRPANELAGYEIGVLIN